MQKAKFSVKGINELIQFPRHNTLAQSQTVKRTVTEHRHTRILHNIRSFHQSSGAR